MKRIVRAFSFAALILPVQSPKPEPNLDAGERGRIRVDGLRFVREDGTTFQWRGFSDLSLYQRFLLGHNLTGVLNERVALGVNIVRVFGMYVGTPNGTCGDPGVQCGIGNVNGLGPFRSIGDEYYRELPQFARLLQKFGLRFEFVPLADAQIIMPGLREQQAHLDRVYAVLRDEWNVVIELCNEPHKNGCRLNALTVPTGLVTASGTSDLVNCKVEHLRDYVTIHTERKPEWPDMARALGEVRDGAECLEAVRRPVVSDEPTGFAEQQQGDSRVTSADDAAFYAGVAAQMGAGATFHSDDGINSTKLRPVQKAAAEAWFWAMKWVPVDAQFAKYQRGGAGGGAGIGDMPIEHFDLGENGTGALRTYNKHVAGIEYSIAIRPEPGWTARPRRGCRVVEEPRRGFVMLRCPQ